jgi:hypothetical protein
LEERNLAADSRAAIDNLGQIRQRMRRRVLQEILERCLYLLYFNSKHPVVAPESTWDSLLQKAVHLILGLDITPSVLGKFKVSESDLDDLEPKPKTWVELAILQAIGDMDQVPDYLPEALAFHRAVTDRAAAHLNLVADNTYRTTWLAAKLLSKDATLARDAACSLVRHLATTRPGNRTHFEQHLFSNDYLWQNLENFSKADPPVLLWHDHGKYQSLFKFLAPRFLLAPDHVLDAERVHARWQWICSQKRGLQIQTLNATLRLMHYLEHNQAMPSHQDLLPHLEAERLEHKVAWRALAADEEVALGCRLWHAQINVE